MMLTQLADIARRTGRPVVEVAGWKTRGHGGMNSVKGIVCHHTAGARTGNYPSLAVVRDGRAGLAGPLAQYGIGRDGTIYVIAAGLCWHAGPAPAGWTNSYTIGIEAENTGSGSEPWGDAILTSYRALCRELCGAFGFGFDRVKGHKEIALPLGRKTDPNFDMTAFRASLADSSVPAPTTSDGWDLDVPNLPVLDTRGRGAHSLLASKDAATQRRVMQLKLLLVACGSPAGLIPSQLDDQLEHETRSRQQAVGVDADGMAGPLSFTAFARRALERIAA